ARALATDPELIVCDEPVAALDVSIRAQVVNLLLELQRQRALSLLFITHDLGVARHVSHRVVVMDGGRVVESGDTLQVLDHPRHPRTKALVDAIPVADPRRRDLVRRPSPGPTEPS